MCVLNVYVYLYNTIIMHINVYHLYIGFIGIKGETSKQPKNINNIVRQIRYWVTRCILLCTMYICAKTRTRVGLSCVYGPTECRQILISIDSTYICEHYTMYIKITRDPQKYNNF